MKASRSRRLVGFLAILWVLLQPLMSSNALVGVFSLVHAHGHEVSVLADSGHSDLVLSHAASKVPDGSHAAERHLHAAPASQGAHVVHLTSSDLVRDSMRRGGAADARAASLAPPLLVKPPPIAASARSLERLAYTSPRLQTVVLRI